MTANGVPSLSLKEPPQPSLVLLPHLEVLSHLADIYTSHTPPFSPQEGPAHHRSVVLRQRARRVGEVGKVGVNSSHRLDPIVEKLGVLIIRDLERTSQALADSPFPLQ